VKIGDFDVAGTLGIKGYNDNPSIALVSTNSDSDYAKLTYDGTNLVSEKNVQASTFIGNLTGLASESTRQIVSSSPTNNDLSYQTPGTVINVEGSNWVETPTSGYQAGISALMGYTSGRLNLNNWTRGFWLYGTWNSAALHYGYRASSDATSITWKQIAFTDSNITGKAAVADKLGTSTVGSASKPIYLNAGTPTAGNTVMPIPVSGTNVIGAVSQYNYAQDNVTIPAGGTHFYFIQFYNSTIDSSCFTGVCSGGTHISNAGSVRVRGFSIRIA
ncbi:MAG: hypothetical protein J6E31_00220, partial [Pyramidobacter sp.]|nr:hypothetical protein [Pyramidobacter sp.]